MRLANKIIIGVFVLVALFVVLQNVSPLDDLIEVKCVGKHNMQLKGDTLPEFRVNNIQIAKIFVLPEVGGFKELYSSFSVTTAKMSYSCQSGASPCDVYVNDQLCLAGIPPGQGKTYTLNCVNLFKEGINTFDVRQGTASMTSNLYWLFFETKISSLVC